MATRKSGHYNSENYTTSRRGMEMSGDMGWEMFPEKLEATQIDEEPDEVYWHQREILKDRTPDKTNLFAHEEVRRNNFSRDRLNVRSGGARVNTDPWQNEDFDTQFHDHDPRGHSTEQPWQEYKRVLRSKLEQTDFKDDGDYSVPSQGWHPNTAYKEIRSAQNWVKSRLKIFSTAKENWHNGGIGKYKFSNVSNAQKVDHETTSVNVDLRYEDAETRQHQTTKLSNVVHHGSKALRVNSTTDHEVKVAAYSKIMRRNGLLNHETQLRLLEDDTRWGKVFKQAKTPRPLVKLMSSTVEGETSVEAARKIKNQLTGDKERFGGKTEAATQQRHRRLTREILSLLGYTQEDVKFMESYEGKNKTHVKRALAQLYELAELLHAAPAHTKIEMRDELALSAAGGGLRADPNGNRQTQNQVILNPKFRQFMDLMVRRNAERTANPEEQMWDAVADSENKLNHIMSQTPLFVFKNADARDIDLDANRRSGEIGEQRYKSKSGEAPVQSYKSFGLSASEAMKNRHEGINVQDLPDAVARALGKNYRLENTGDHVGDVNTAQVDNDFGENRSLTRHGGRIGTKHLVRAMTSDHNDTGDDMNEIGSIDRKNPTPVQ